MTATDRKPLVTRETLEDRLNLLWLGIDRSDGSERHSELYERLHLSIRETAARLVLGVHGEDELQRLCELEAELESMIRDRILDWAELLVATGEPPSPHARLPEASATPQALAGDSIAVTRSRPTALGRLLSRSVAVSAPY